MRRAICGAVLGLALWGCETSADAVWYSITFDDAAGLKGGSPVYVAGVQVGHVRSVRLDGVRARVEFEVSPPAVRVHEDACVSVGWYGIGAGPHLKLEPGAESVPSLNSGGEIRCVRGTGETSASAEKTMKSMEKVLRQVVEGKGTIGRLLYDERLADKVEKFFEAGATPPTSAAPSQPEVPEPAKEPPSKKPKPRRPADPPSDLVSPFK